MLSRVEAYLFENGRAALDHKDGVEEFSAELVRVFLTVLVHVLEERVEGFLSDLVFRGESHENGLFHLAWVSSLVNLRHAGSAWNRAHRDDVEVAVTSELPLLEVLERLLDLRVADLVATVAEHFKHRAAGPVENAFVSQRAKHCV